jgi:ATP-dependent DNA helicase RecQ
MTAIEALKKYFNYNNFRSGQLEIIEEILASNNVLAVLPTGAGKSICFQIPALISNNYSIVISPLIALMKDQVDSLNKNYEVAAFINSSLSYIETERVLNDIKFGKIKLVYVAPERLENPDFSLRLKNLNPNYLFIDEAHCISEWGHNFRPSYTKIKNFIEFTGIKKISAFTATATPEVVKDIIKQLGLKNAKSIIKGFERDNLFVNVEITKKKNERCFELLQRFKSPAIVYTSSRKKTEELADYLKSNKIKCEFYHAGLDTIVRKKIQEEFIDDALPVIIATNAFGMGIDKKDIRLVIHYNSPGTIENYYQEIGRAGRDGKSSNTYLLFDESDIRIHDFFISNSYPTKDLIKKIYNAICDSAQVAIGMQSDKEIQIDFNYLKLHTKQEVTSSLLNSSLKFLAYADYIKINSAFNSSNKIKILFEQKRLKNFIKETPNEFMRDTLLSIVRNFGSDVFSKLTKIDFKKIINDTGLTDKEIIDTLTNLEYLGILEFSKSNGKETISLIHPRVKAEELKLNYKLINELYISSKQKLDKMVDFVYSNDCRFKYILNYFGEDVKDYSCGKCDNCLKKNEGSSDSLQYVKEKVEDLIGEFEIGLSEKIILNVLLGKDDDYLNTSPAFASLKHYKKEDISKALRILVNEEIIVASNAGKNKTYMSNRSSSTNNVLEISTNEEYYDNNLELFHKLREAREKASKKFLQSPHIICPDEVLAKVSKQKPKTKIEMMQIAGFNERMFNKIGNDFLEIINSSPGSKNRINEIELPKNIVETYNLLQKKYSLEEIAKVRKLTESVISMQIESILSYKSDTDISSIIDSKKLEMIRKKIDEGIIGLKELKASLPSEFSYPELRIALAKFSNRA